MRFERAASFDADFARLSREHQRQFRAVIPEFHDAVVAYVQSRGSTPWPRSLRVKRMTHAPGIWEMTWSYASPDGRATFQFVARDQEALIRWRRIGNHSIYRQP